MKSRTYKPGDLISSLYDLKPAITCPICNSPAKVSIEPKWSDQEGGQLTTTNLELYAFAGSAGKLKRYSIDIFTKKIDVSIEDRGSIIQVVARHELLNEMSVKLKYCGSQGIPHYLETITLNNNIQDGCVREITLSNYVLSNKIGGQIFVIISDSKSIQLKTVDVALGVPKTVKLPSGFSVERAAELIKTNRYLNFL